jgi:hypothetical protein
MLSEATRAFLWGCATLGSAYFAVLCVIVILRAGRPGYRYHFPPEAAQTLRETCVAGFLLSQIISNDLCVQAHPYPERQELKETAL